MDVVWITGLLTWLEIVIIGALAVLLYLSDADLSVRRAERFGHKPGDKLRKKVVWIIGASSGIGEHLAYELAKSRSRLILSSRRIDELNRVKRNCLAINKNKMASGDVAVLVVDALQYDTHKDAAANAVKVFGHVDMVVLNSGRSQRAWVVDTELAVDKALWEWNLLGSVSLAKAILPHMIDRKAGHIVVTSSIAGKMGCAYSASYSAAKFALQGWFDALRLEVTSKNITVTVVHPGPVNTPFQPKALTGDVTVSFGKPLTVTPLWMPPERCAYLMTVALANELEEVWISRQPYLFYVYVAQYMPSIHKWWWKQYDPSKEKRLQHVKQS